MHECIRIPEGSMSLLTVLLASGAAHAADRTVDPLLCGMSDFCTIQEAVDASVSGDRVVIAGVGDGLREPAYKENIVVDGARLASLTILSFLEPGDVIWQPFANVGTQLTVTNGASVTIENLVFELGTESCIQASGSTVDVVAADFVACGAPDGPGGAISSTGGSLSITDSRFVSNIGTEGGAVFHSGAGEFRLEGSTFDGNSAVGDFSSGGAVYVFADEVSLIENDFYGNISIGQGGGVAAIADTLYAEGNVFQLNQSFYFEADDAFDDSDEGETVGLVFSSGQGGGVFFDGEALEMRNNLFCGNLADDGGGVYGKDIDENEYYNNVFADNWATHYGGGINVSAYGELGDVSEPIIVNNTFIGNSAGLFPDPQVIVVFGAGGSIALDGTLGDVRNNIISYSYFGGGIYANDGELFTIGDPIAIEHNLMFENCDFINCDEDSSQHYTSDLDAYAVSISNIRVAPDLVYYRGESDCNPDAFYPDVGSPVIDNGDPTVLDAFGGQSDIGAYGGPGADVKDEDADGWVNIYDCNDLSPLINPVQADVCDGIDNNCDGQIDEDFQTAWYPDADRDGRGDANVLLPIFDCADRTPMVNNNDDCYDSDPTVFPTNPEACDGKDNDCNGTVDDPDVLVFDTWVIDNDSDGFGDDSVAGINACAEPVGGNYARAGGDCDDTNAAINPLAEEICDGSDNDCDGLSDEDPTAPGAQWYLDADGDGVGTGEPVVQCDDPGLNDGQAYVNDTGDCDDADPTSFPAITRVADGSNVAGGADVCDGRDNDCNGEIDDDINQQTAWYVDGDADGFGDNATAIFSCDEPGSNYVVQGGDCDDENPDIGECAECGCQAAPTSGSAGLLGLLGALLLLRRRRD
jgi:MYXO-CTERM domain-containing protein